MVLKFVGASDGVVSCILSHEPDVGVSENRGP